MPNHVSEITFENPLGVYNSTIQAAASNLGGLAVRQDYLPVIGDYRVKVTKFWNKIKTKLPAASPIIQEMISSSLPTVAFAPRGNLEAVVTQPPVSLGYGPGQEVKAIVGRIHCEHFALSMAHQQKNAFGDQMSTDTDNLILSAMRFLERSLFTGDARVNPLAFNGMVAQMPETNVFTADITTDDPDAIHDKIDLICQMSAYRPNSLIEHYPTHIFCSGAGNRLITKEIKQLQLYHNVKEITPGVRVPAISTSFGEVEIVPTVYLQDKAEPDADIISYYIVDMNNFAWFGVYPYGGERKFEPQIFDLSHVVNGLPTLRERMIILYGTPKAMDEGRGIFRLDVRAPRGSRFEG
jgi:hypothetical protein